VYYHNVAAATGCVIAVGSAVALLVRAKEPARGKLDLPGGFVDPDEDAISCLRRECREEIGWDPGPNLTFLASFPNTYPYKNIVYKTCDSYFTVSAPDLDESCFTLDPEEIAGVRFIRPELVRPEDLAFDSTRKAVAFFLRPPAAGGTAWPPVASK
jgi:8-oxo-dGTP pyrophosphatase MutT (NUDIX family)